MAKKKDVEFKEGDQVTACPEAMKCPKKTEQLINRTGLSVDQLREGPMHIVQTTSEGQLHIKHPRLGRPFVVHEKFITHLTAST